MSQIGSSPFLFKMQEKSSKSDNGARRWSDLWHFSVSKFSKNHNFPYKFTFQMLTNQNRLKIRSTQCLSPLVFHICSITHVGVKNQTTPQASRSFERTYKFIMPTKSDNLSCCCQCGVNDSNFLVFLSESGPRPKRKSQFHTLVVESLEKVQGALGYPGTFQDQCAPAGFYTEPDPVAGSGPFPVSPPPRILLRPWGSFWVKMSGSCMIPPW